MLVAQYTGLGSGMVQKLFGYLMPMVLGGVAGRFAGKSLNPQSLPSMLSDKKANIASSLPTGFSLSNVPGLALACSLRPHEAAINHFEVGRGFSGSPHAA
jgi:hypothetical protein